jgi:hypothetical protein
MNAPQRYEKELKKTNTSDLKRTNASPREGTRNRRSD